jgi:hypothetical protein
VIALVWLGDTGIQSHLSYGPLGFIGSKLEEVRAALVRRSREARKTEQARRLAAEADKIAEILNQDFRRISERLHEIRAASSRKGAARSQVATHTADNEPDEWTRGIVTPGVLVKTGRNEPNPQSGAPAAAAPAAGRASRATGPSRR